MTRRQDEAEDVAQEAVLRVWRFRGTLRGNDRRRPWIRQIVRNEALRALARRQSPYTEEVAGELQIEDQAIASAEQRLDVRSALQRLDPEDRLLLELRYGNDMTQPAIARRLGMPEGTVKVRLHRARKKLRAVSSP